jgi:hypothetical protein
VYTERFSLPFIAQVLIAAAERRRPGLGAWTPEVKEELKKLFQSELAEIRARFLELFDDKAYWAKVEKAILEDCFDRYSALAEKQTALEQRDYGVWRGGDVVSRIILGIVGLGAGVFIARAPFIPLPTSADVIVLITALGTPVLPDLQVWLHQRRYRKGLRRIVRDMEEAAAQQKLYQPLPVPEPVAPVSAEPHRSGEGPEHTRNRG